MRLSELAAAMAARVTFKQSELDAFMEDIRRAGVAEGPALQDAFTEWADDRKYKTLPTPKEFLAYYRAGKSAVDSSESPRPYMPDRERIAEKFTEIDEAFRSYLMEHFGRRGPLRPVYVGGRLMGAHLHPANEWMAEIRRWRHRKIERAAYCAVAWEDGRMGEAEMKEARAALSVTVEHVERAKKFVAKTPVVNTFWARR